MTRNLILWTALATSSSVRASNQQPAAFVTEQRQLRRVRVVPTTVKHSSWSVGDDWSSLSNESPDNTIPDSNDLFNVDLAAKVANQMTESSTISLSSEDVWTNDVVDKIYTSLTSADPPMYDTGFETFTQTIEDEMGKEIALLIRCNERPEQMLIAEGRALPPLTDEDKNDPLQLVQINNDGVFEATDFFKHAVSLMFREHATPGIREPDLSLDAAGVANWMMKSLGTEPSIGKHDRRVVATISQFGDYGSGRLTEENFQQLYLAAVVGDHAKRIQSKDQLKFRQGFIHDVWRDLRYHGIMSPVEEKRQLLEAEMQTKLLGATGTAMEANVKGSQSDLVMDECEILEWDDRFEASVSGNKEGKGADWRKSSHEIVELASDGKTPLWLRDGDFVFIDEESCIGCTQCASVSPSSFLMLEGGRARTFSQRNTADVDQAVAACPVNCMHRVSFPELKEFETVRDHGDGRTDHRHMGRDIAHTPLNVAGVGGDASHKDSWYHYVKNKCFMSKQCPQRGCFDCPYYSTPGQNPYWKKQNKEAEHVRAQDFMEKGVADPFRKAAEL